ncbi:MAG: methyltransferase domain-containing protein [Arenicellales bacterium]|nr:methyltransferase domain-containing protein [Arenicellales bacterium]
MSGCEVEYDEQESRTTERAYQTPEITAQRVATLQALSLRTGESVLDIGVGPGLLSYDMAQLVGEKGRIVGIDNASAMVAIAQNRCGGFAQVEIALGDAQHLEFTDADFDAAVCVQVLLYIPEVRKALVEMHRVLNPGGRVVIIETDWRGLVLNSSFPELTEKMIASWDAAVSSPQLPPVLEQMLKRVGFSGVSVMAVPVLANSYVKGNYAHTMLNQLSEYAVKQNRVTKSQAQEWLGDLSRKQSDGAFFFCVNRFLFKAFRR